MKMQAPHTSSENCQMHAFGGTRRSSKPESEMLKRLETSSVELVREPYRDVPVNLITAPRNDMPTLQNIWAHQKSFLHITHSMIDAEEQTGRMSGNGANQIFSQSYTLMKPKSNEHYFNLAEADCTEIVRSSKGKNQSLANDKLRRARISEGIKALQNCLPYSNKRNKESAFDDLIDYVKFLKLQLKVLSESCLGGEETDHRFVHVEGYGHYLLHQQMSVEPLGEMMGQLMESDMLVANQLLESKGIALFPLECAYTLLQNS